MGREKRRLRGKRERGVERNYVGSGQQQRNGAGEGGCSKDRWGLWTFSERHGGAIEVFEGRGDHDM